MFLQQSLYARRDLLLQSVDKNKSSHASTYTTRSRAEAGTQWITLIHAYHQNFP